MSTRFKADKWRGVWIITDDGNPRSVNGLRMSECGNVVTSDLYIRKAYEDKHGCSDVRCYRSAEDALDMATSLNEQYEERLRQEEEDRQEALKEKARAKAKRKALREKRKKERREFILECLRTIFNRNAVRK